MVNLEHEFTHAVTALANNENAQLWVAKKLRVDLGFLLYGRAWLGVAKINPDKTGTYQPCDNGVKAIIIPNGRYDPTVSFIWDEFEDLIAFAPEHPEFWWQRTGISTALGECWTEYQVSVGKPVHVVGTPLEFLRMNGKACCVLDWGACVPDTLTSALEIYCSNRAIADRLRSLMTPAVRTRD